MKFGFRKPSLRKSLAARTSIRRAIRSEIRVPRELGWITNPRKAAYNRIYHRTTRSCFGTLMIMFLAALALIYK